MEGGKDPFNRRTYPWGREDPELLAHFRALGQLRKGCEPIRTGKLAFLSAEQGRIGFSRTCGGKTVKIYVNLSGERWALPAGRLLLGHRLYTVSSAGLTLEPMGFCAVEE